MSSAKLGPIARREARLAWRMLLPTVVIVFAIVLLPLLTTFWISVKPVTLTELRPATPIVKHRIKGLMDVPGQTVALQLRLRNSSQNDHIKDVKLLLVFPQGIKPLPENIDQRCRYSDGALSCRLGEWPGGHRERLTIALVYADEWINQADSLKAELEISLSGHSQNVLTNLAFTTANFTKVFDAGQFWQILWVTLVYTFVGTAGALVMGLFAAQLLQREFRGRAIFRGLFLFPYVAPVIAMAFTWLVLFDPYSGVLNALLLQMDAVTEPINFFGTRSSTIHLLGMSLDFPVALAMVIAFEIWRYFPLAFMFILARMQSTPQDMFEAAEMDGASPLQQFWHLALPQLFGIIAVLFLLRFIWTFNKFDDIFLLTGGNAGTRTLTVDVYEQAFALSNLGAGAAVAVVIFFLLLLLSLLYFRSIPKEEGL